MVPAYLLYDLKTVIIALSMYYGCPGRSLTIVLDEFCGQSQTLQFVYCTCCQFIIAYPYSRGTAVSVSPEDLMGLDGEVDRCATEDCCVIDDVEQKFAKSNNIFGFVWHDGGLFQEQNVVQEVEFFSRPVVRGGTILS
tara:strand:+ start:202 stop:615 length:414 start_codon:yes stop_codon:yes gene_type:complete